MGEPIRFVDFQKNTIEFLLIAFGRNKKCANVTRGRGEVGGLPYEMDGDARRLA